MLIGIVLSWFADNEIIVDAKRWRENLPFVVEAIFGNRDAHERFLSSFNLEPADYPFLEIDVHNWQQPLKIVP